MLALFLIPFLACTTASDPSRVVVEVVYLDGDTADPGDTSGGGDTNDTSIDDTGTNDTNDTAAVDADGDGYTTTNDCDDTNAAIYPGAAETCDGVDEDCNGVIDNDAGTPLYLDADDDGYGDPSVSWLSCGPDDAGVPNDRDCDDNDADVNPDAYDNCNGVDSDCDGGVDEDGMSPYYADCDDDGFGDAHSMVMACSRPDGYVINSSDDDDHGPC